VVRRRQHEIEALPRREELDALVHHYYHLRNEHERADPESSTRRRLEDRLLEVREQFDRLLEEWVPDPELQEAWREYLRNRRPEPSDPHAIRPLVFQGRSEVAGSVVEIRRKGDELQVEVDGSLLERVAADKDLSVTTPALRFRVNGTEFDETFSASPEALRALADFLDQGGSPPWEYASELLADGLIDVHFDLTPRGRRALARLS
jgi:glutamine synthetase adenylyltransferase